MIKRIGAVTAGLAVIGVVACAGQAISSRPLPPGTPVTVRVLSLSRSTAIPPSYLGLSTEYWTIPVWAKHLDLLGRVFSQITPDGPLVLRIGGDSSSQAIWAPVGERSEWAFEITPGWLSEVSQIITRFGVKVILDLNLVTATPQQAALWAKTAEAKLPHGSIVGFEIGNEPDIYSPAAFKKHTKAKRVPPRLTAASYAAAYTRYDNALDKVVPNIPLMAPALSLPDTNISWIAKLLSSPHHGLTAITIHRYALSACAKRSSPNWPTVARVLNDKASAGLAATIKPAVRLARRAHIPVRLTETNSVTCGGIDSVSDTFSTALWAPDVLFEFYKAGAQSVDVHVRANAVNMAFSLTNHGLVTWPLTYGLMMFARTLGAHPHLLSDRVTSTLNLKAWAVRDGHTIRVLLINKSSKRATVTLDVAGTGPASVERLTAPKVSSEIGVTLGGQQLDPSGQWVGTPSTETVARTGGGYRLSVGATSAALVQFAG